MKRSPLNRKKELKARKPLESKAAPLSLRKPLKARSKKMENLYKDRREFVAKFLSERPVCEANWDDKCAGQSVDVHEVVPRGVGGKIVSEDLTQFMAVCRYCHIMITTEPAEAHRRGFRKWSWEQ